MFDRVVDLFRVHGWKAIAAMSAAVLCLVIVGAYFLFLHTQRERMEAAVANHDHYEALLAAYSLHKVLPHDAAALRVMHDSGELMQSIAEARNALLTGINQLNRKKEQGEIPDEEKRLYILKTSAVTARSKITIALAIDPNSSDARKVAAALDEFEKLTLADFGQFSLSRCNVAQLYAVSAALFAKFLGALERHELMKKGGMRAVRAYENGVGGAKQRSEERDRLSSEKIAGDMLAPLQWIRENLDLEGSPAAPAVAEIKAYTELCNDYVRDVITSNSKYDDPPPVNNEQLNTSEREIRSNYDTYKWNDGQPELRKNAMARGTKLIAGLLAGIDPYANPDVKRAATQSASD